MAFVGVSRIVWPMPATFQTVLLLGSLLWWKRAVPLGVERVVSVEIVLVQSRADDCTPWTKSHEERKRFTFWIIRESKKRLNYVKFKFHCPRIRFCWNTATPFVYEFSVASLGPRKPGNCDHDALRRNIPTIWLALAEACQVIPCQEGPQKTVSLHC